MANMTGTATTGQDSFQIKSNGNVSTRSEPLPIVIVGGGCVGLFLALVLCQFDVPNRVMVIEPATPNPTSTRAMAHQPLIFPLFEHAGLMPDLSRLGSFSSGLCFRTSVANGSKLIAGKVFKEGEKAQLLLPQYKFQELLISKVNATERGSVIVGKKVVGFSESPNSVSVKLVKAEAEDGEDEETYENLNDSNENGGGNETIEAFYLIGADGAHSTIRRLLSLPFEGTTLPTQLVATDIKFDFHAHDFYDANFIIDPSEYGLIGRIDNDGLWRVSYGVPADTSDEEIKNGVNEKLQMLLPNQGKGDGGKKAYEVKRIAPYRAQQRIVSSFWPKGGRVGVLGDAAHLTNPYAGLGLASGIADAASLAEILVRILKNAATDPDKLLQSWSTARRQIFLDVVDKPSRAAYHRVQTDVSTDERLNSLLEKDPLVGALKKGMPMIPPSLATKGTELEGW